MKINLDKIFDELFPICRSITGDGIRNSLNIMSRYIPFKVHSIKTGSKVFDWTIPKEWRLKRAYLSDTDNNIIIDTNINNLHVLNFSQPFKGTVSHTKLRKHIFTSKELPNAIPYVTSYYKENWGLCMSYNQFKKLKKDFYKVNIDTVINDGHLNYATFDLKGKSKKLIFLSSYLCHPSMANNELSGPLAMIKIYDNLKKIKNREYTYRFIIGPETIGTIAYLHKHGKKLSKNLKGGIVLTCLGGNKKKISFKLSRRDWVGDETQFDKIAKHLSKYEDKSFDIRSFSPTGGSDERQYCSPGFNMPVIQAAKTIYEEYPEYHTSLDNKKFMKMDSVEKSASEIIFYLQIVELMVKNLKGKVQHCEPHLSKKNLYPFINTSDTRKLSNNKKQLNMILSVLSLSDGNRDIIDIANFLEISVKNLMPIITLLKKKNLL